MIWKACKIIALLPLLLLCAVLFFLPLLWLPWYCILGAFCLLLLVVWFVLRVRARRVVVHDGSGGDPWSRKSEVIKW